MAEYIDREAFMEDVRLRHCKDCPNDNGSRCRSCPVDDMLDEIEEAPTACAVTVVRCKECIHYVELRGYIYNGKSARHCLFHQGYRYENDFCSDGVRRCDYE